MTPAARLAAYLEIPENDPRLRATSRLFSPARAGLLQVFPFLALMHDLAEKEGANDSLVFIEAMLFNAFWVDRYINDADSFDQCRKKLADILWVFTDDCKSAYVKDPTLCVWAVVRSLMVERNARKKGFAKFVRSREVEMLDRVIADCQAHRDRGLPPDLADRLHILESHGVLFPSDIYTAVADSIERNR